MCITRPHQISCIIRYLISGYWLLNKCYVLCLDKSNILYVLVLQFDLEHKSIINVKNTRICLFVSNVLFIKVAPVFYCSENKHNYELYKI